MGFQFEPLAAPDFAPPRPIASSELPSTAPLDAEALREQARLEGYEEGYRSGLERAQADAEPTLQALAAAARELERARNELEQAAVREAAELGLRVAEKILGGAIDVQPERVLDVVTGALRRLDERERVTLVVAPEDLELVRAHADGMVDKLGGLVRLDVQADRRVARGGAVVRTPEAELDARLAGQLERAREIVAAQLAAPVSRASR